MINYSIIIPHYNIPDLLGRCLRSIPEREDVQVIVVDDNSPGNENYLRDIPELSRKNVEFYITKDGLGAGHARNVGLSHAIGKWLIFADADDFFVDDLNDLLNDYLNCCDDIIYFTTKTCDCYKISIVFTAKSEILDYYEKTGDSRIFRIARTEPWGKFIKRQLVLDNDLSFQETKAHNDLLFSVKTGVLAKSISFVKKPLYWYVIREGSLGHQKGMESIEKTEDRILAWYETQLFLNSHNIKTRVYLPVMPCLRVFKHDKIMYCKLLTFMRQTGINYWRVFYETVRYCINRIYRGDKDIKLHEIVVFDND